MSNTAFSTVSTNPISTQPATPCKIYFRSSDNGDVTDIFIYGYSSGTPTVEAGTVNGTAEQTTTTVFDSITQVILSPDVLGTVTGYSPGISAIGDLRGDTLPAAGSFLIIGDQVYTFQNTLGTPNDVKIQGSIGATMVSLCKAINLNGTVGTDYASGTVKNGTYSATVATDVITVTDLIPCLRLANPPFSQSSTYFSLRVPRGGVDGLPLFVIQPGITVAANPLLFSTEDHSTVTLPALMLGISPAIYVDGQQTMLRLWSSQEIRLKIQSSTDQINWSDTADGIVVVPASTLTTTYLSKLTDFIRMVLTENNNTTDTIFDGRAIY